MCKLGAIRVDGFKSTCLFDNNYLEVTFGQLMEKRYFCMELGFYKERPNAVSLKTNKDEVVGPHKMLDPCRKALKFLNSVFTKFLKALICIK